MAKIINPVVVINGGGQSHIILTVASTITSPALIKEYFNNVIPQMSEIKRGKFYAVSNGDWADGTTMLRAFTVNNGAITTDSAIRSDIYGNLTARSWASADGLRVNSGATFEFIPVGG